MQAKQGDYRGCYIEKTKALHNSEKERANNRK